MDREGVLVPAVGQHEHPVLRGRPDVGPRLGIRPDDLAAVVRVQVRRVEAGFQAAFGERPLVPRASIRVAVPGRQDEPRRRRHHHEHEHEDGHDGAATGATGEQDRH